MTFDSALLLGVDVGSSRTKALLVDPDGTELGSSVVPTPFESSAGGTEAPVDSMVAALGTALDGLGDDRRRVAAVGIAGIAESGAPLDRHGSPLGPVVAWHDRRGETVAERLSERFGRDLDLRIGQQIRYVSSVAKLGWLVDNGLTGVARWLGVPELGLHALTGAHATEYSLAARTGCWDVSRRSWLPEVAGAAGFGIDVFADVGPAGEVMGRVSADAAAWSGLPAGTPVTLAGHDHLAGVVGSGAGVDDLANSVGTAETVVGRTSTVPEMDQVLDRSLAVTVFPGGDGWAVLAGAARAGLAISAAAVTLGLELDELDRLAGGAPLLDAPDLLESLRLRQPPALPDGPPGAVWNTLLGSLVTFTAEAVADVTALLGARSRLVVFGGGANSTPWLAAKAVRLRPLPLWRATTAEAVARGAALLGGVAAGWWTSPADAPAGGLEPAGDGAAE